MKTARDTTATDRSRPRRGPKKATPAYLERAALFYLERYAAPAEHLRRLLMAKVARSARFHGTDAEAGGSAVDALIERFQRSGLLDDAAYAAARVRSLHRRGASARGIRARLRAKGVAPELTERALEALAKDAREPDLAAALRYARRRRLGPFRAGDSRSEQRARDLAALGRQGFDLETAHRVIDGDPEELAAEAQG